MSGRSFGKLLLAIGVCQAVGILGSIVTATSVDTWYQGLVQPALAPPDWLFGPVWTALYTLMGIAVFLVLEHGWQRPGVRAAVVAFGVQLFLNALWSVFFFGTQGVGAALLTILALFAAICATIVFMRRVSLVAAALMLPYAGWVLFATYLNYAIWVLN